MEPWIQMIITIACSVIASSGFLGIFTEKILKRKMLKQKCL